MSFVKNYTTNEEEHRLEKVPCKVVNNIKSQKVRKDIKKYNIL